MGEFNGMYTLDWGDVIVGRLGTAFIQYEGQNIPAGWLRTIEVTMEKNKSELAVLGEMVKRHRSVGATITGSANMFYCTSLFRKMASEFANNRRDIYFDLVVTNSDPTSVLGTQAVLFKNCNADSTILAKLDVDSDEAMNEDMDFTADGFELLESFVHPSIPIDMTF